jgi:Ser/Thr protein kinase RdoA (MazF antagonist)
MFTVDEYVHVFEAFGLDAGAFRRESIYAFGPVFHGSHGGSDVVVKRTRSPLQVAEQLLRWTGSLAARGIAVITPSRSVAPNPVAVGDEVWVAYPFIRGGDYVGTKDQLTSAGRLLGAIHAASKEGGVEPDFAPFAFPDLDPMSIDEDVRSLRQVLKRHLPTDADVIAARYDKELSKLRDEYSPALRDAGLVRVVGPWDYKANNLVYVDETPVLVDPDSAGFLPRLLDLALAAVLFHNEQAQAPGRMFSAEEWKSFWVGYSEHIAMSPIEVELWPTALEFMRLEEGLWLALNDEDGWSGGRQRAFLTDLLMADLSRLTL